MPAFPSPLQAGGLAALLFLPAFAHAQTNAPSRITSVKLYPGSATVERTARVPAGSRSVTFRCLPQGLDARSLQVVADAPVRVGDIGVQVQERALAGGCASPLDERVRAAQDQLAASQAETDALELAHTYLKTVAGTAPTTQTSGPGTPGAGNISVTTDALRRSAQDTLMRLHQAKRRQEALELDVRALTAERDRIAGPRARVATVTVALAAEREGDVRLAYQVRGPSWSPSYRATLDSGAATVRLERLALVAQSTGEDWSGVPLVLSTGQPLGQTQGSLPRPWTVDVQPEPPAKPVAISMAAGVLVKPLKPDWVILSVGSNDRFRTTPAALRTTLADYAQRLRGDSSGRLLLLVTHPPGRYGEPIPDAALWCDSMREAVAAHGGRYVDLSTAIAEKERALKTLWEHHTIRTGPDDHFNAIGAEIISTLMLQACGLISITSGTTP